MHRDEAESLGRAIARARTEQRVSQWPLGLTSGFGYS